MQFAGNEVHQQVVLLQFLVDDAEDGQHIFLLGELDAVVHLSVEVDGEVGNLQERTLNVQQMGLGLKGISASHNHAARKAERAVHPRGEDCAAIGFGVEFDDAALGVHFCVGLDAEGGRIAMSGNDACACLGQGLRAHLKGENGGIILGHVETAAGLNALQRFCGIVSRIASSIQLLGYGLDGKEIHRRGIEEI